MYIKMAFLHPFIYALIYQRNFRQDAVENIEIQLVAYNLFKVRKF